MDRRVKERLVGASILVVLIVLIVPELLSGPKAAGPVTPRLPVSTPPPVRNVTVDLATSKPPAPEPLPQLPAAAPTMVAPASTAAAVTTLPAAGPSVPLETALPSPTSSSTAVRLAAANHGWAVQLGSFASRTNADKLAHQLKAQGFSVYVSSSGAGASVRYRVRIGPLSDRGAAAQDVAKLKVLGHAASIVAPAP
jgi:DedD protein